MQLSKDPNPKKSSNSMFTKDVFVLLEEREERRKRHQGRSSAVWIVEEGGMSSELVRTGC